MFPEGIMITDMVPVGELESITIDEMVRFARERGFHAEQSAYELTIRKDGDEVFHQKFFRRKYVPVIDYLTAMSKATGMYRIEILLHLKAYREPEPYIWIRRWDEPKQDSLDSMRYLLSSEMSKMMEGIEKR